MDQYKQLFNQSSLYETLFFTIITKTKYDSINTLKEKEPIMYDQWIVCSEKLFGDSTNDTYLGKGHMLHEFSEISSIGYGLYFLKENDVKKFYKFISGTEKSILETFIRVLDDFYKKKPKGLICGYQVRNHNYPMISKVITKLNLKLPQIFKENTYAKPWENSIIDVHDMWKFNGNTYTPLETIAEYLNIDTINQNFDNINKINYLDSNFSLEEVTKNRYRQLTEVYLHLRNI